MPQLPEIVRALLKPEAYPEAPSGVKMEQTQMSFVFLTGDYAYKVKKPVDLGYLDYTTLEKRLYYCRREVELNRRLCPDAYLGVLPITQEKAGILVGGKGNVLDYAVKMRNLPLERMLNLLLAKNQVSAEMIATVARKIAEFHQQAETNAAISSYGELSNIIANAEENFNQTVKYIGNTISEESYRRLKNYTSAFIEANALLFRQRIVDGRIRDCHGDLHAAHVCFTDGICIYDCIEFNDRFRYCDVASEVAFLAMDLDNYGRKDLSESFIGAYVSFSGDGELSKVLDFYKCYRAYVRGKVESFKLDDPNFSEDEKDKTSSVARRYFELAESYLTS